MERARWGWVLKKHPIMTRVCVSRRRGKGAWRVYVNGGERVRRFWKHVCTDRDREVAGYIGRD